MSGNPKIEKIIAEVLEGFEEACLKKIASRKVVLEPASQLSPKVVEKVVTVSPEDPNYDPKNQGRVRVDIYEQMYWSAVDRAFNRPVFAEVVSGYHPFDGLNEKD
jgi:hypothetical protein